MVILKLLNESIGKYTNILLMALLVFGCFFAALNLYGEHKNYEQTQSQSQDIKRLADELVLMNERIEHSLYSSEAWEVEFGLADATTNAEIVAIVAKWRDDRWGSQLSSLWALCEQDGKEKLHDIVNRDTAIQICRMVP